jgi:hypothetical protein
MKELAENLISLCLFFVPFASFVVSTSKCLLKEQDVAHLQGSPAISRLAQILGRRSRRERMADTDSHRFTRIGQRPPPSPESV